MSGQDKPKTNAEAVKYMTDKQLMEIWENLDRSPEEWYEWLSQEPEEENNE